MYVFDSGKRDINREGSRGGAEDEASKWTEEPQSLTVRPRVAATTDKKLMMVRTASIYQIIVYLN